MRQERTRFADARTRRLVEEPDFMLELVAELSQLARRSPEISQRSGVSVRVSIANLETLSANAVKRAVRLGEPTAAPRISDLGALIPSTTGKIELETLSDEAPEERVVDRLLSAALYNVFGRRVDVDELDEVVEAFEAGLVLETGERSARASTCAGCARRRAWARPWHAWVAASRPPRSRPPSSSCSRASISTAA